MREETGCSSSGRRGEDKENYSENRGEDRVKGWHVNGTHFFGGEDETFKERRNGSSSDKRKGKGKGGRGRKKEDIENMREMDPAKSCLRTISRGKEGRS